MAREIDLEWIRKLVWQSYNTQTVFIPKEDAEEVVNDIVLDVWLMRDRLRMDTIRLLIRKMVFNQMVTRLRSRNVLQRKRETLISEFERGGLNVSGDDTDDLELFVKGFVVPGFDEEVVERLDSTARIDSMFEQRGNEVAEEIFRLVADGHSYKEISEMTELRVKSIDNLLTRERREMLKPKINKHLKGNLGKPKPGCKRSDRLRLDLLQGLEPDSTESE